MTDARLRHAIAALAALGAAVAGYLTYVHYAGLTPLCVSGSGSCEVVQSSRQSMLAGLPVALLGLGAYALIATSAALRGRRARLAGAFLALSGLGFSAWLTYQELFVIDAVCQWCVVSAALMAALAALTSARQLRES